MSQLLWKNFFKQEPSNNQIITDYWARTPLFKNIPKSRISALVNNMHVRHFDAGETIFHQNDQGAGAILIKQGSVRISANHSELASLTSGDFFGEVALAQNEKRTANAVALEDTEIVFFLKQDVDEWINYEPKQACVFLQNLSEVLAMRLLKMNSLVN